MSIAFFARQRSLGFLKNKNLNHARLQLNVAAYEINDVMDEGRKSGTGRRRRGRDHVFTFGSGMSKSVFQSWGLYLNDSIALTPETELFNDIAWVIDSVETVILIQDLYPFASFNTLLGTIFFTTNRRLIEDFFYGWSESGTKPTLQFRSPWVSICMVMFHILD